MLALAHGLMVSNDPRGTQGRLFKPIWSIGRASTETWIALETPMRRWKKAGGQLVLYQTCRYRA